MAFAALNTGVSGVIAYTDAVAVVSDNIANVNTVGYKRNESQFSSLVVNSAFANSFSPGGVEFSANARISEQGLLTANANPTALAIDGQGFFVVNDPLANSPSNSVSYTRAGNFLPDQDGILTNTSGQQLLGFPLDNNGLLTTDISDASSLKPIDINDFTGTALPTTSVELNGIVPSTAPIIAGPAAPGDIANGTVVAQQIETFFVVDGLGIQTELNAGFVRTGANTVAFEIYAPNPGTLDLTAAPAGNGPDQLVSGGVITFNGDGTINQIDTNFPTAATLGGPTAATGDPLTFSADAFYLSGANTQNLSFDFGTVNGGNGLVLTNANPEIETLTDGAIFGSAIGVDIDDAGIVTALFDNGVTQAIAQVPLATFPNPDGMTATSGPAFLQSASSGPANLVLPGSNGSGGITAGALEASTVDLANEFSDLIVSQRAFSANARTISTADEILQELTNII